MGAKGTGFAVLKMRRCGRVWVVGAHYSLSRPGSVQKPGRVVRCSPDRELVSGCELLMLRASDQRKVLDTFFVPERRDDSSPTIYCRVGCPNHLRPVVTADSARFTHPYGMRRMGEPRAGQVMAGLNSPVPPGRRSRQASCVISRRVTSVRDARQMRSIPSGVSVKCNSPFSARR